VYVFLVKRTLNVLNELEKEGHYERYTIGGAMGATFYIEPQLTDYLDIFVTLPQTSGGIITLGPLYEALPARGYKRRRRICNYRRCTRIIPASIQAACRRGAERSERSFLRRFENKGFSCRAFNLHMSGY
jgi:hypothetical protein